MTFMPWTQALSVGMPAIDEQHHWLVDTMNCLHSELASHEPDREEVGRVLEGLMDYTVNHFVAEEVLFQQHAYPQAAAHKALHDQFTQRVMQLLTAHEAGQSLGGEVVDLLKDWLVQHIMGADHAYVPCLIGARAARDLASAGRGRHLRSPRVVVRLVRRAERRRRARHWG